MDTIWKPGWEQISTALLTVGGPEALFRSLFEAMDSPQSTTKNSATRELSQIAYSIRHRGSPSMTSLVEMTEPAREMLLTRLRQMLRDPERRTRDDAIRALKYLDDQAGADHGA